MTSCGALPASVEGTSAGAPEEHRCVRCGTAYLPFRRGVPCPSCGVPSTSESGIVPAVLDAYARNLRDTGRPIPLTIQVATLWDDYLYRGLFFLKAVDGRRPRESEGSVIARMVESFGRQTKVESLLLLDRHGQVQYSSGPHRSSLQPNACP